MAVDLKYGQVTTERGDIAGDEPVVVFRARDQLLPDVLKAYAAMCRVAGSPQVHLGLIDEAIAIVEKWQASHFTQIPRSDASGMS